MGDIFPGLQFLIDNLLGLAFQRWVEPEGKVGGAMDVGYISATQKLQGSVLTSLFILQARAIITIRDFPAKPKSPRGLWVRDVVWGELQGPSREA